MLVEAAGVEPHQGRDNNLNEHAPLRLNVAELLGFLPSR